MKRLWLALALVPWSCAPLPQPAGPDGAKPAERIVFFGDSLVHRSEADHGLVAFVRDQLVRQHPSRHIEAFEEGRNGDQIADLAKRLERDVLRHNPTAVVLYWDSDVSDVDETGLSQEQIAALRTAYEGTLTEVLQALVRAGAHVILSGPSLLGELPHGRNPRDAQLDAYLALNRRVARRLKVQYLDTRRLLMKYDARHYALSRTAAGTLTEDGEHLSAAGTRLVGRELLKVLDRWLRARERAEPFSPRRP